MTDNPISGSHSYRDEHGRFVAQPSAPSQPISVEAEEIAQFCGRCGLPKGDFDIFCGRCSSPLLRRFRLVLTAEVFMFVAAAVLLALAHQGKLAAPFHFAPLVFLTQAIVLYFARLSLRQPRFVWLATIFVAFVASGLATVTPSDFLALVGPLYVSVGVIILWISRWHSSSRAAIMQTLWVATLFAGLSLSAFKGLEGTDRVLHPAERFSWVIERRQLMFAPFSLVAGLLFVLFATNRLLKILGVLLLLVSVIGIGLIIQLEILIQDTLPFPDIPFLYSHVVDELTSRLRQYTPWFGIAGLCVTLAIEAGLQVARRGIAVREDYFPNSRLSPPGLNHPSDQPLFLIPLVIMLRNAKRALVVFYNTLVSVVNLLTRSLVYMWQTIVLFLVSFFAEAKSSVSRLVEFAGSCLLRVVVPLFAVYVLATVCFDGNALIATHTFAPSVATAALVIWTGIQLVTALFASVLCYGNTPAKQVTETFARDLAVSVGYGIPLLLMCSLALTVASNAAKKSLELDLGFRFAHISWACLLVLLIGAMFLWGTRLVAVLRSFQKGTPPTV